MVVAQRGAQFLRTRGLAAEVLAPSTLDQLRTELTSAAEARPRALVACGGDGTVHHVLAAALERNVPLGILPAGTGNDIARSLGFPLATTDAEVAALAEVIARGETHRVDVTHLEVEGRTHHALAIVTTGFDSAVNERANEMTRLRGTARYVAALLAELRDLRTYTCDMTVDDERITGEALLIAVGNGATYGGGMRICPSADMEDGLLDVTWVDAAPRRTILRVFPRIFSGRHVHHPLVRTAVGGRITIDAPGAMVYADGERIGAAPVAIHVLPGALQVWRPDGSDHSPRG